MLMCNGVVLNTTNPTTELEKQVARELHEMAKEFNLKKRSGSVVFVYPDALIKPDRDNPGRFDSPRGINIKYVAAEVLENGGGTREWRYFTHSRLDAKGLPQYTPSYEIFTGRLELGLQQIELIYYLLKLYPYTEGGANSHGEATHLKRQDIAASNRKVVAERGKAAAIAAKLYLNPSQGGYSDEELKDLALKLNINVAQYQVPLSTENRDYLILTIDNKYKTDPSLVNMAKESQSIPDVDMEIRKIAQQAKDFKLIALLKHQGRNVGWGRLNHTTNTYDKFVGMPINTKDVDMVLYKQLIAKPDLLESFKRAIAVEEEALANGSGDNNNDNEE